MTCKMNILFACIYSVRLLLTPKANSMYCVLLFLDFILHELWVNVILRSDCTCLVHVMLTELAEYGKGSVHIMVEFVR